MPEIKRLFQYDKGLIYQEDITILKVYTPDSRTSKSMKQNLVDVEGEMDKSITIVRDLNTTFSIID